MQKLDVFAIRIEQNEKHRIKTTITTTSMKQKEEKKNQQHWK